MWVETASAFSLQMAKVGLVGIYGAATPDAAGQLVNVIVSHFHRLVGASSTGRAARAHVPSRRRQHSPQHVCGVWVDTDEPVAEEDLARARNQLRSAVMMNLELRGVLCEDIGRQVLTSGKRITPQALCEKIAAVTAEDIQVRSRGVRVVLCVCWPPSHELPSRRTLRGSSCNALRRWRCSATRRKSHCTRTSSDTSPT